MKVTVRDIVESKDALLRLLKIPLRGKTALLLSRTVDPISKETANFKVQDNKLIEKIGTPMKKSPDHFEIKPNTKEWFQYFSEKEEILATEIELPFEKIEIDYQDIENAILSPEDIYNLKKSIVTIVGEPE